VIRLPRYRTGDSTLDDLVARLVEETGGTPHSDQVFELIASAVRMAREHADRGDLKIANAALKEMRYAFRAFAPYRVERKAAIFGSARVEPHDPLYEHTRRLAATLADRDWMVITGAGPGIMEAGVEGAGPEQSFGVSIRLPFEAGATQFVSGDPKLVNFRYFFTRKLAFIKEAHGFVLLPGGFGTLDEAFELLTLIQTGKTEPAPVVLLDVPGGTYWAHWRSFVESELAGSGYISKPDLDLVRVFDDIGAAVDEIIGFYANYQSQRFVQGRLVLRMRCAPSATECARLSNEFADILLRGEIERIEATEAEIADDDTLDLERLALWFDRRGWARLRVLIDALNGRGAESPGRL
jgi:uncharacterized protein (TIGR00730 family)